MIRGEYKYSGHIWVYTGHVSQTTKQPEGVGIKVSSNGIIKEGCWENDKLNGFGRTIISAECYIGDFKNDKMHGFGTFYHKDGKKYIGQWEKDMRHGQGTQYKKDGSVKKSGIWKENHFVE